jgi:hypothetical protein
VLKSRLGPRLDLARGRCQKSVVRWPTLVLAASSVKAGKGTCSAICGLLALGQVLAFAHVILVGHRTCVLHGEVVHVGSGNAPVTLEGVLTSVSSSSATLGHEHDHCLCMAPGRERFLSSALVNDGSSSLVLAGGHAIRLVVEPALPIALLSFAPKNSPPA